MLDIVTSSLDGNSAAMPGGGIYNYEGGSVVIEQSTLSGNTALTGGIYNELFIHNTAYVVMTNSTLSGNSAAQDGGGIYAQGGILQLFNTTIAYNSIFVPQGIVYNGLGGGLYVKSPAVIGGYHLILANNSHQYGIATRGNDDCFGTFNSIGYNLIATTTNCTIAGTLAGNITGMDPLLGPLQYNGGFSKTHALPKGSPAIDAGYPLGCTGVANVAITTDERGWPRPFGARCDIGAFEYSPWGVYLPLVMK